MKFKKGGLPAKRHAYSWIFKTDLLYPPLNNNNNNKDFILRG